MQYEIVRYFYGLKHIQIIKQRIDSYSINNQKITKMGSGCLKPPPAIGEIDLSVLDSIYQDIRTMDLPPHHSEQRSLKMYEQIRQRITKKGQLRKLCDYLSSHRSRICQTVLHSFRITNQSKIFVYKYVAIIVLEGIFNSVPKNKPIKDVYNQSKVMTVNSSFPNRNTLLGSQKQISLNEITNRKILTQNSEAQQTKNIKNISNIEHEITSYKFQAIYFNFISVLLKQSGTVYKLTLQNLIKFCSFSNIKFNNQTQVFQIMKNIGYHIQTNDELPISLKAYSVMLERVRQSYFAQNNQMLRYFFDLYAGPSGSKAKISTSLDTTQQQTRIQQSQICLKIIQCFIKNCIQSYHYNPIIEAVIQIFDANKFNNISRIENLLFNIIEEMQLKNQFNKSLILYLMAYVGYPPNTQTTMLNIIRLHSKNQQDNQHSQSQEQRNMNILQKKWAQSFNKGNPDEFRKKYKNVLINQCKLNSIPAISKWIFQYNLVEIGQLISYSGLSLIYAYALNMHSVSQQVKDKAVLEMMQLVSRMQKNQKINMLDLIMMHLEQSPIFDDATRFTFLTICENIVDKQKQYDIPMNNTHIFQTINACYCFQINIKIIQIMGKLYSKLTRQSVSTHLSQICQFYHVLFKQILHGFTNTQQKLQMIETIGKYLNFPGYFKGIHVAYLELIQNQIQKETGGQAENCILFLDYLFMRTRNQNLQSYVDQLKKKKNFQQFQLLQSYATDRVPMNIDIDSEDRASLQFFNESTSYFRSNQFKEGDVTVTGSVFWKGGKSLHSRSRDSVHTKGDQDLQDVLDILKND